jgi:hypothetical protein
MNEVNQDTFFDDLHLDALFCIHALLRHSISWPRSQDFRETQPLPRCAALKSMVEKLPR